MNLIKFADTWLAVVAIMLLLIAVSIGLTMLLVTQPVIFGTIAFLSFAVAVTIMMKD